ncbi:MAG: hypothetical protein AAGJ35_08755, partial [Myxococcota bacterium]
HWHGVSFTKLLDALDEQKELQQLEEWLDRQRLKEWCNFLVEVGVLHAFRGRARLTSQNSGESREVPTLLRMVPEHVWVKHIRGDLSEEQVPPRMHHRSMPERVTGSQNAFVLRALDFYRLIVIIEHYLHISNNDAVVAGWMPMSTLFHVMGRSLERSLCNAIVRAARDRQLIDIRTHDPRPGQHPARGVHLALEHELTGEARARVLKILELIQTIQDQTGVAELAQVEAQIRHDEFFGDTEEERVGWVALMREENLLLVRPTSDAPDGEEELQCTLNFRDRYVLVLLESLYPSAHEEEEEFEMQQSNFFTDRRALRGELNDPFHHKIH